MSVLAVREQFARQSGRHDLVTTFGSVYTDNGADFYLNAGQRMLDRKASFLKSDSWYRADVPVNTYKLTFPYSTSIKEVWRTNATGRFQMEKKDLDWLRANYYPYLSTSYTSGSLVIGNTYYIVTYVAGDSFTSVGAASNATGITFVATGTSPTWANGSTLQDITIALATGPPLYYAPVQSGLAPSQRDITALNYSNTFTYDYEDVIFGNHWLYNGVLFLPPTEGTYTISILGRWLSAPIADTSPVTTTYWTEVHPDLLVMAGQWALEALQYRNREGMADFLAAINDAIKDLDADVVEQESAAITQMEG
jgi:hypothetical protein